MKFMWTIRRDSSQRWHDVLPQHFFSQRYIMKKREEREKERERERERFIECSYCLRKKPRLFKTRRESLTSPTRNVCQGKVGQASSWLRLATSQQPHC
jgi:hypothetical protein